MASNTILPLLLLLLLLFFATSTSARPCKSLFFITSTSYYTLPSTPNPNPRYVTLFITPNHHNPNRFFLIPKPFSTRLPFDRLDGRLRLHRRPIISHHSFSRTDPQSYAKFNSDQPILFDQMSHHLLGGYGRVKSSIKDRSKDIISVVGALLFGMGCGALTAATMYLVWALFAPKRFEFEDSDDEGLDGGDDDLYKPNKVGQGGYMVIPSKVVDDQELKKPLDENVDKLGA